jgi:hypothetical protein
MGAGTVQAQSACRHARDLVTPFQKHAARALGGRTADELLAERSAGVALRHHAMCIKSAAGRPNTNDTHSKARDILTIPVGAITAIIAKLPDRTAEKEPCRDNDDRSCRVPGFDNGTPNVLDEGYASLARSWHH